MHPASSSGLPLDVPSHLVWSILLTIFCCLPFGVVAIVYSTQVNGFLAARNYAGAQESSRNAATWCWLSFAVGLLTCCLGAGFWGMHAFGSIGDVPA
jgi:cytochrome bd-type quinol oxidase subunit 2